MFDDLRKSASESYKEYKDEPISKVDTYDYEEDYSKPARRSSFLGMSAPQRFILALMVLFMSCVLASFFLILTGKIALPIF